ncbi:MAG: molybdate-binding protein [Marmoricola sp.]|nr:molybdate-binding protein [Marmoricola sp.]
MSISRRFGALSFLAVAAIAAALLAGCGSSTKAPTAKPVTLTVFAASSLTGTFTDLGKKFEATHPGVTVSFDFGGSSDLVAQIQQGAPADVFASADESNMAKLASDHLQGETPRDFASNTLEIVTPPNNPAHISSFADLGHPGINLVICAPEVPCGAAAKKVAAAADVTLKPVSEEQSVKDVLAKVTSGDAMAGLVYATDVKAAGAAVHGVVFPQASSAVNTYPIVTITGSKNGALAREFMTLVLGATGQTVLAHAGFARP